MFAIEVKFSSGVYYASKPNKAELEWPPHPFRLYKALVSAVHTHVDLLPEKRQHRETLKWLEGLSNPSIEISGVHTQISYKKWVTSYGKRSRSSTKLEVSSKPRWEPYTALEEPYTVKFIFEEDLPYSKGESLGKIVNKVPYLGRAKSLTRMTLEAEVDSEEVNPTYVPCEGGIGDLSLRVPSQESLEILDKIHNSDKPHREPQGPLDASYLKVDGDISSDAQPVSTGFGDTVVLEFNDLRKQSLSHTQRVMTRVKKALTCHLNDPSPMQVGHESGKPAESGHMALAPLPFVGNQHSDGTIKGVLVMFPEEMSDEEQQEILRPVLERDSIKVEMTQGIHDPSLTYQRPARRPSSLKEEPYTGVSKEWETVTPVVPAHYGDDFEEVVKRNIKQHLNLPEPASITKSSRSSFDGVPSALDFNVESRDGDDLGNRPRYHFKIEFDTPIKGPLVVGKGRFIGLGLCRRIINE